ncbi:carboxypeptidase-like regulatory domain-containing protein [Gimesia fumaroli]|nr:carboxypeptidase-like regulatory domain-containing protein [Gimesia fumaroli]
MCLTLLSICFLSACGANSENSKITADLVPVTGTATFKGKPLAGASITLIPQQGESGTQMASAVTNDSGTFELITPMPNVKLEDLKGAIPGRYKVVISKFLMPDGSALPPGTTEADAMTEGAKESLPPVYSNFEKTKLAADIKKETGEGTKLDFVLN